jgi:diaminopropionate ammonia-lyase
MTLLDRHFPIQHVHNPRADRTAPYGDEPRAVLDPVACAAARREIETWPGYAPTPLLELPGFAAQAGFGRLWYKDEADRFQLGSFKALGGAFAVSRILIDAIRRRTGQQVSIADLPGSP